ncbi:rhodanese-like domain-containing protein [Pontiellaceae bacterium B12219]|nr:rhodanese-like domain-containing protein [Pontiellaceae bacterium B12219]
MVKTIGKIALAVVVALLFTNLLFGGGGDNNADVAAQVKDGALIIDTRTPGEFSNGHVQGALNIPYDSIARSISQYETNKTKTIIVYCRSGNRSAHAKQSLISTGYTNVIDAGSIGNMHRQLKK